MWDLNKNTCVQTLEGHSDAISALSPIDSRRFVSGGKDGYVRSMLCFMSAFVWPLSALTMSQMGLCLCRCVCASSTLRVWQLTSSGGQQLYQCIRTLIPTTWTDGDLAVRDERTSSQPQLFSRMSNQMLPPPVLNRPSVSPTLHPILSRGFTSTHMSSPSSQPLFSRSFNVTHSPSTHPRFSRGFSTTHSGFTIPTHGSSLLDLALVGKKGTASLHILAIQCSGHMILASVQNNDGMCWLEAWDTYSYKRLLMFHPQESPSNIVSLVFADNLLCCGSTSNHITLWRMNALHQAPRFAVSVDFGGGCPRMTSVLVSALRGGRSLMIAELADGSDSTEVTMLLATQNEARLNGTQSTF